MKCLIVVAHPDDEVIWMGGCILRHPDWDWRELSLCRGNDPDRAPRFRAAAEALGVRAEISDLDDSPTLAELSPDLREITERIGSVRGTAYDLIFTHGPMGEYTRHPRHEQVHDAVRRLVESGDLAGALICFAYSDRGGSIRPKPAGDADIRIRLTDEEFKRKREIIRDIYNFGVESFEFEAAGPMEAFRICIDRKTTDFHHLLEAMEGRKDEVPHAV